MGHPINLRCGAHGLVLSPALLRPGNVAVFDQWGVAELHGLVHCYLFVLNEAVLLEVLLALLLLLGVEVRGVSGVALLAIAVGFKKRKEGGSINSRSFQGGSKV